MTTFLDGPAKGQHLMLKASPKILRVVVDGKGHWDALDLPSDKPRPDETVHLYELAEHHGGCFIDCGGKAKGASGFYQIATYRYVSGRTDGISA
jgi:hypothetical protein